MEIHSKENNKERIERFSSLAAEAERRISYLQHTVLRDSTIRKVQVPCTTFIEDDDQVIDSKKVPMTQEQWLLHYTNVRKELSTDELEAPEPRPDGPFFNFNNDFHRPQWLRRMNRLKDITAQDDSDIPQEWDWPSFCQQYESLRSELQKVTDSHEKAVILGKMHKILVTFEFHLLPYENEKTKEKIQQAAMEGLEQQMGAPNNLNVIHNFQWLSNGDKPAEAFVEKFLITYEKELSVLREKYAREGSPNVADLIAQLFLKELLDGGSRIHEHNNLRQKFSSRLLLLIEEYRNFRNELRKSSMG